MAEQAPEQDRAHAAVLDEAHVGDIRGAFGTIRQQDLGARRTWRARLLTLAAIVGPGLIVMVGDNDAGGVATYAQAGQTYGTSLLWTLVLLVPVLVVNQEMVVRLGAVTGVGHARLIRERFGRFWAWFSVGDLFVLDFLTIVTEFIGVDLALSYFGVSRYLAVPLAALALIAITASGSFERWERLMLVFVVANFLIIPLAVMSHPRSAPILHGFVPGIRGGLTSTSVLLVIAIVGTTVAPWQLFFQQSNIIDKRITPRWINYERVDTVLGSLITVVGAGAMIVTTAFAVPRRHYGAFVNAGVVAHDIGQHLGSVAGALFAVVLLNASLIGAAAVTLGTSYAFGDIFGTRHSLHRKATESPGFYAMFAGLVAFAAGIVLIPHAPLGVITTAVQALAGVLLPSASVFLLLLCNDREVLGPWVNALWLNVVAAAIVGVLIILSLILVATTIFPTIDVRVLLVVLFGVLVAALSAGGVAHLARRVPARAAPAPDEPQRRETWRMPPLALLGRPAWSRGRTAAMWALRAYLVVAVLLLVVKAVELATAHPVAH